MTRFTLPAFGMLAAIAVLFAGAFADLPTWRRDAPVLIARTRDTLAATGGAATGAATEAATGLTTPHERSQPVTIPAPANDLAQRQVQDLNATIARETRDLAALRTSVEEVRRDLATLREQRDREQAVSARTEAEQPASSVQTATAPASVAATRPASATGTDFANAKPVAPDQRLLAARWLDAARMALTAGRHGRARWLLSVARTQMAQWPSAVGQHGAVLEGRGNRHRLAQSG